MGHEGCGAVTAAMADGDNGHNLNMLTGHIKPAVRACGDGADLKSVVDKNAELTAEALVERSAIISDAVSKDKIKIVTSFII